MKLEISLTDIDQRQILALSAIDPVQCARIVVNSWLAGRSEYEPTWRTLLTYLRSIHYNSVAQQIENYFGVTSTVVPRTLSVSNDDKPGEIMVCVHSLFSMILQSYAVMTNVNPSYLSKILISHL